mgnify:FL=1
MRKEKSWLSMLNSYVGVKKTLTTLGAKDLTFGRHILGTLTWLTNTFLEVVTTKGILGYINKELV